MLQFRRRSLGNDAPPSHGASLIRIALLTLLVCTTFACQRSDKEAVTIVPGRPPTQSVAVPGDPFAPSSSAYGKLREVTEGALAQPWDGELESFAGWLEEQTVAVERSLALLKALRVGPQDVYAVANGRIALVYEQIAMAMTEATPLAEPASDPSDWKGQEARIWEQAYGFWARCARLCSTGGTHLDAWDLRCSEGMAVSRAKLP